MNNRTWLRSLLCLCLAFGMVWPLCACGGTGETPGGETPGGETPGGETPGGETPGGETPGGETPGGETPGGETPGGEDTPALPTPERYGNGAAVKGGGATIAEGTFALTATTYDPANAEETKASTFFRSATKGPDKIYRVSDDKPVTISGSSGQSYDGKGTVLIAPKGLVIEGCHELTLVDLIVIGPVTVKGSSAVTLERVEIVSEGTALAVDAASSELKMNDCRLTGKTAIELAAPESAILHSYLAFTENGLVDTATAGTTLRNCVLEGSGTGITTTAADAVYRGNTLTMREADTGIVLAAGVKNGLVALNVIENAQSSITVTGVHNTAVILNSAVSIEANDSRNLYICDNSLGGRLTANHNNYFLADGNETPDDEYDHTTVQTGNQNHNGNNLMDVDARPEVGADEALLPHVDKDLFVGMERRETVKDLMDKEQLGIASYILEHCKTDEYVILAPGAYKTDTNMALRAEHSNSTIYAYGVYMERQSGLGQLMNYNAVENVTIKGMTIGFKQQSCGQVYVLDKLPATGGKYYLLVVTGAGMMNEFGNTNTTYFDTTGIGAQRMGTFYAYADADFNSIQKLPEDEGVPVMRMEVSKYWYEIYRKGDIFTCRAVNGGTTIGIYTNTKNVKFIDFNIYGNASGFAYVEQDALSATTYYRVCNTTRSGEIISEELYNAYLALEEKYGVDLEVEIDELGRFRGSPAHIGSQDATHTTRCAQGSQATFCLFENMCDDATNQNTEHARLDEVKDNGDGTTTMIYKGDLSEFSYGYYKKPVDPSGFCSNFKVGDRVYVYTSKGQLVCDIMALSATAVLGTETFAWKDHGYGDGFGNGKVEKRSVTVKTEDVNFDALQGFDLKDNHHRADNKVLIDNMSMASSGFRFDNCKFQNIRSRGLLICAAGGVIQNCTFRNIGMACAAMLYEIYWGETGVTENMLIDRNLFDHTGYFHNAMRDDLYASVSITGLGSSVEEDYLLYKNIVISNNVIRNRTTNYAVYVNSAKDVKIINNHFGEYVGNDFGVPLNEPESVDNPKPAIHINGAMNVEISGNKYSQPDPIIEDYVHAERNKNVYGSDVEMDGMPLIPDDID